MSSALWRITIAGNLNVKLIIKSCTHYLQLFSLFMQHTMCTKEVMDISVTKGKVIQPAFLRWDCGIELCASLSIEEIVCDMVQMPIVRQVLH